MTSTADAPAEWEPGDELYSRANHPYSLYIFNFRDDSDNPRCGPCNDAASWPDPRSGHQLPDDPLAGFIAHIRTADG